MFRISSSLYSLVFILTGCFAPLPISSPATPSASLSPAATPPVPIATRTAAPLISSNAISLTVWTTEAFAPGASPQGQIWRDQFTAFQAAHPNITINLALKKPEGKGGILDSLMTTRTVVPALLPDVVIMSTGELALLANARMLQPIEAVAPAETGQDMFPFLRQFSTEAARWLAVPFAVEIQHAVFNQAAVPTLPRTWDDVTRQKVSVLLPLGGDEAFLLQYLSLGASLDPFDASAAGQVLMFFKRARETGFLIESALNAKDTADAWNAFAAGQIALAQVSSTQYLAGADKLPSGLNVSYGAMPTRDGKPTTMARGWAFAILTNDPTRRSAAARWIDWLTKAERIVPFLRAAYRLPATRGMLAQTVDSKEYAAFVREMLERALPQPSLAQHTKRAEAWRAGITAVWRGQMTPEEAARNIAGK